jgi:hypothetical protein
MTLICILNIPVYLNYKEVKMDAITLDELIVILQQLSIKGYGNCRVWANLEYNVTGAGVWTSNNTTYIDIDCTC